MQVVGAAREVAVREFLIVGAITALMCLLSGVWFAPWEALYYNGIWVTLLGFAVGVPTGIVYHVRLYRVLHPRGDLPSGWYWRPIRFNRCLRPEERGGVMIWCYVGALGFFVICIGLLMMGSGAAIAIFRGV